jgi:hypothetical protein
MSTSNTRPLQADGKDAATVQGFGTLGFTISMRDFFFACEELRKAGVAVGATPFNNGAGASSFPFDGVLGRV